MSAPRLNGSPLKATILIATAYFVLAKIGQLLAIPPGNVTPIWLPSGVILALALRYGWKIAPGVFLGAFFGNASSYWNQCGGGFCDGTLLSASMNGAGDVLATVGAAAVIRRLANADPERLFTQVAWLAPFIGIGCILGSLASAIFGATGLLWGGFITSDAYLTVFVTWLTGDAVGVLLLAPLTYRLIVAYENRISVAIKPGMVLHALLVVSLVIMGFIAGDRILVTVGLVTLAPLLLWSNFNHSPLQVYLIIVLLCSVTIIGTALGAGPFASGELNENLINLQLFLSAISTTVLYSVCSNAERRFAFSTLDAERNLLELRVEERTDDLKAALDQRETLIQEVHHRVKNNLQVILSMLSLQRRSSINEHEIDMLSESDRRIRVMAKLYEHLYQTPDITKIDAGDYFETIVEDARSSGITSEGIVVAVKCENVRLDVKTATACAQIISELVSNAIKHAFPTGEGNILVSLDKTPDGLCLAVQDDGTGLGDVPYESNRNSMGIKLVKALVMQLDGQLIVQSEHGTRVEIHFGGI